jgi:hypothetical protein
VAKAIPIRVVVVVVVVVASAKAVPVEWVGRMPLLEMGKKEVASVLAGVVEPGEAVIPEKAELAEMALPGSLPSTAWNKILEGSCLKWRDC